MPAAPHAENARIAEHACRSEAVCRYLKCAWYTCNMGMHKVKEDHACSQHPKGPRSSQGAEQVAELDAQLLRRIELH